MKNEDVNSQNGPTVPCIWCGSLMVKKNGPYGEFWGCLRYPECKHTTKGFTKGVGRSVGVEVKRHSNLKGKNR